MSETSKSVGLNDEQTPTPNIRNAVQLTSLANSGSAIDALPTITRRHATEEIVLDRVEIQNCEQRRERAAGLGVRTA